MKVEENHEDELIVDVDDEGIVQSVDIDRSKRSLNTAGPSLSPKITPSPAKPRGPVRTKTIWELVLPYFF